MNKARSTLNEENLELIAAAQQGDEGAAEAAVERNMALVRSIAKRYAGRAELEDLVQIGCMGLLKAVRRFDFGMGVCFSTFAVPVIAGEIKRFLRDDGIIKVSRRLKETAAAAAALSRRYTEELGRLPTIAELELGLMRDRSEISAALGAVLPCLSIESMLEDSGKELPEPCGHAGFEAGALDRVMLAELLTALDPRQRAVICMRYFADRTQKETAKALGMTQVQVSRLESRSISFLRQAASGAKE